MTWRRRHRQVLVAQHAGDLGQPARHDVVGRGEQVVVPAGRARPPRRSRTHDASRECVHGTQVIDGLRLRQPLEQRGVGRGGGQRAGERRARARRRRPPRSAGPRPCATSRSTVRMYASRRASWCSSRWVCRESGSSRSAAIASAIASNAGTVRTVLDDVLPPPLGVVVPGRLGQHRDRVGPDDGLDVGVRSVCGSSGSARRVSWRGRPVGEHGTRRAGRRSAPARRGPPPSASPATPARRPRTARTTARRRRGPAS